MVNSTALLSDVEPGGRWSPWDCYTGGSQRVTLIVPYRDRPKHLQRFIKYMHSFLQKQRVPYIIYIVEQVGWPWDKHTINYCYQIDPTLRLWEQMCLE